MSVGSRVTVQRYGGRLLWFRNIVLILLTSSWNMKSAPFDFSSKKLNSLDNILCQIFCLPVGIIFVPRQPKIIEHCVRSVEGLQWYHWCNSRVSVFVALKCLLGCWLGFLHGLLSWDVIWPFVLWGWFRLHRKLASQFISNASLKVLMLSAP